MSEKTTLKPATLEQAPLIAQLAEQIWRVHYPPIIGNEQVEYMLQKMYGLPELKRQLAVGNPHYLLIEQSETVIGFIGFEPKPQGEAWLHKFYILPEKQGSGVGAESLRLLEQTFPKVHTIRLQVNRQNFKAINFYFKNGFTIEQVADFDIGGGYFMNDFIMKKTTEKWKGQ